MREHQQASGRERWPLLEADNMIEMLSYLGTSPLAERQVTDEIEWIITGVWDNTFTGVVRAHLSESRADQVIDELGKRFQERDIPHLWVPQERQPPWQSGATAPGAWLGSPAAGGWDGYRSLSHRYPIPSTA